MNDNGRIMSRIVGISFLVVLFGLLALGIVMPDKAFSDAENRNMQKLPEFRISEYLDGRFEKKLESYVDDQFPLRSGFIKIKSSADRTVGKLENNGVFLAENDYLMEDIVAPSDETIEKDAAAMQNFAKRYPRLRKYFLLAPTAANILADKLPQAVVTADQNAAMDQMFERTEAGGFHNIDVRDAFRAAQTDVQLYYRTDHHWTTDGAYEAFRVANPQLGNGAAATYSPRVVKNDFRGTLYSKSGFTNGLDDSIRIYLPSRGSKTEKSVIYYADTQEKTTEYYQMDKLDQKDAYQVFGGSNHPMYTIQTPVTSSKRLLLIKDSYANSFIPFLTQYYREIVVVDPRYYFDDFDDLIETEGITDVLFLYNANTFFSDDSMQLMLS